MKDTLKDELFENLKGCLNEEVCTKDILCELRIEDNPTGNKQWEIELFLTDPHSRTGESRKGFFACHQSKGFVTYSITLHGQEYWFDRYQAALEFLGFPIETSAITN